MKKEREFLHDLASPIATAKLLLEAAIEDCEAAGDEAGEARLKKVMAAVEKISTLLTDRRDEMEDGA